MGNYSVLRHPSRMSFLDTSFINDLINDKCEVMDLFFYDDDHPAEASNNQNSGLKSIIKKRSLLEELNLKPSTSDVEAKNTKTKKSVLFRDPICDVRLYDKVAAKRQQWGHATKFCRVKRFCWDDEKEDVRRDKINRWLPNTEDQDYRLMMWRDVQQRRLNRKRRQSGESLAFMVQGLEISPACVEVVQSKMRRMEERT